MNVFIDTNIYLDFFAFTSDTLAKLEQVLVLNKGKRLSLVLTEQVVDEYVRNRSNKVDETLRALKQDKYAATLPRLAENYPECEALRRMANELERTRKALLGKIEADVAAKALNADLTVGRVMKGVRPLELSEEVFQRASRRVARGNPPGKKGSLGDALNWEMLLDAAPRMADLHIIAKDNDYYSEIPKDSPNEYLALEYKKKVGGTLYVHRSLAQFLKLHFKDYEDVATMECDIAVEALLHSTSFKQTHSEISTLSRYSKYTLQQARIIAQSLIDNRQVNSILADPEILEFVTKFWWSHHQHLAQAQRERIEPLLEEVGIAVRSPLPPGDNRLTSLQLNDLLGADRVARTVSE